MCSISVSCGCTLQLLAVYQTTSDLHHFVELVTHIRVVHYDGGHFVQLPKEHYAYQWERLEGGVLTAVLWVVLELEVDWVVQSMVVWLEPVVLWLVLEVDWVVQSMVVPLEPVVLWWCLRLIGWYRAWWYHLSLLSCGWCLRLIGCYRAWRYSLSLLSSEWLVCFMLIHSSSSATLSTPSTSTATSTFQC